MNRPNKREYAYIYFAVIMLTPFTYMVWKFPLSLGGLGGAFLVYLFTVVCVLGVAFSKLNAVTVGRIILVGMSIVGINFLSFLEMNGILNGIYFQSFFVGNLFCMIWIYMRSLRSVIDLDESKTVAEKKLRSNLFLVIVSPFVISIPFICVAFVVHMKLPEYYTQTTIAFTDSILHNFSLSTLFVLVISFMVQMIYMLKFDDKDLKKIVIKNYTGIWKEKIHDQHQTFKAIVMIVLLSSLLELTRRYWILWIMSVLLCLFMILTASKLYDNCHERRAD